jgi:hypothetical protein
VLAQLSAQSQRGSEPAAGGETEVMAGTVRRREWTTRKGKKRHAWYATYYVGVDRGGKRYSRQFKTPVEARIWLAEIEQRLRAVVRGVPTDPSFGDLWAC